MAEIDDRHRGSIRKEGEVTKYRPDDPRARGRNNQAIATGKDGAENLSNTGQNQGGAAGQTDEIDSSRGGGNGRR